VKPIIIYISIILFILSCSHSKEMLQKNKVDKVQVAEPDTTTSNYEVFNYVAQIPPNDYYMLLDSLQKGFTINFFTLRMAYSRTPDYSPYDSHINDMHKKIRDYIDNFHYNEAISIADSILSKNYVDLLSHLYCGYAYKQLKDTTAANFHYSIYDKLLRSIAASGDGYSPKTAYIVITIKEEYILIEELGLARSMQSLMSEDGHFFDRLETTDQEKKENSTIYFNIDLPYNTLRGIFK
jgi:hypothetical protein